MSHTSSTTTPSSRYLEPGPKGTASDMRVVSGYPVWNLIDTWLASDRSDQAVLQAYGLSPAEWSAAREYYLAHRAVFDAVLIRQLEPLADELPPGLTTADQFYAWLRQRREPQSPWTQP